MQIRRSTHKNTRGWLLEPTKTEKHKQVTLMTYEINIFIYGVNYAAKQKNDISQKYRERCS